MGELSAFAKITIMMIDQETEAGLEGMLGYEEGKWRGGKSNKIVGPNGTGRWNLREWTEETRCGAGE